MEETLILMTPSGPVNIAMQVVATVAAQLHPTLCNPMDCKKSQAPLSMGFPRQEYRSGLPFPFPEDLPDPGIKPTSPESPALQGDSSLLSHQQSPYRQLLLNKVTIVRLPNGSRSLSWIFCHLRVFTNNSVERKHVLRRKNCICKSSEARKPRLILYTQISETGVGIRNDLKKKLKRLRASDF